MWMGENHRSQKWVKTSRATYHSNYCFVMASRLLRIRTWSTGDDNWYLGCSLCFLHHVNKRLLSGVILEGRVCWLSLQGPLFKQAHRIWCQRYKRSAGRVGIDSKPLSACINESDYSWWKLSQSLLHTVVFFKLLLFSLHFLNQSLHSPLTVSTHPFDSTQLILVLVYNNLFSFESSELGEKSTTAQLIHRVQIKY